MWCRLSHSTCGIFTASTESDLRQHVVDLHFHRTAPCRLSAADLADGNGDGNTDRRQRTSRAPKGPILGLLLTVDRVLLAVSWSRGRSVGLDGRGDSPAWVAGILQGGCRVGVAGLGDRRWQGGEAAERGDQVLGPGPGRGDA